HGHHHALHSFPTRRSSDLLDATQQIFDSSEPHIVTEVAGAVRDAAGERPTLVIGENEPQQSALLRPPATGGCALDGLWNDDFHRSEERRVGEERRSPGTRD